MKACPFCHTALFPRQTACPQCGARRTCRRDVVGWSLLLGGVSLLLGGLLLCAVQPGLTALAQIGLATALLWSGERRRQEIWRKPD